MATVKSRHSVDQMASRHEALYARLWRGGTLRAVTGERPAPV
jgi:hypothetical protein